MSAWGKTHLQAKLSWKINMSRSQWSQHHDFAEPKRMWWRSLYKAVFGTKVSGLQFSQGIPFVLMEMRRRMLGAADPQGPRGALGVGRAEIFLHCLLSLSLWSSLLASSDASLHHFSKAVCNILVFPALLPVARRRIICLVPAHSGVLKHHHVGTNQIKTKFQDARIPFEPVFCLQ